MSSPAANLRSRVTTLGDAAVEKARLTVVPSVLVGIACCFWLGRKLFPT